MGDVDTVVEPAERNGGERVYHGGIVALVDGVCRDSDDRTKDSYQLVVMYRQDSAAGKAMAYETWASRTRGKVPQWFIVNNGGSWVVASTDVLNSHVMACTPSICLTDTLAAGVSELRYRKETAMVAYRVDYHCEQPTRLALEFAPVAQVKGQEG